MTARAWVRRAQRRLGVTVLLGAALWGAAVALAVVRSGGVAVALAAGAGAMGLVLWRARFLRSLEHTALWIEARVPRFRYALITAMDPRHAGRLDPRLAPALEAPEVARLTGDVTARVLLRASLGLVLGGALFTLDPGWPGPRGTAPPAVAGGTDRRPSRLAPLRVEVRPPAYARAAGITPARLEDPTAISGLAGSEVHLFGPGTPEGIVVRVADSVTPAVPAPGDGWSASFTLPAAPARVALADRGHQRLLILAPRRDDAPAVQLLLPAADTTLREADGLLRLEARIRDDIGLAAARFEFIVSSGATEGNFTSRDGVLGARRLAGPREDRLAVLTPLAALQLAPGDQLTVRAVATDNNTLGGPGTGYSEARVIRIARPGESDSLAVDAAPPPSDSAAMTLRYLIQLTGRLHQARGRMARPAFVDSATGLGLRAERLKARVQHLQNERSVGGMLPPSPLLNAAYLALAEGESDLRVAEPGEALPPLRRALGALQEFAQAERYYLRGRGAQVVVDLARVRLSGSDTGRATARTARPLADTTRARMARAYRHALATVALAPAAAVEQLTLLQAEAAASEPALAGSLEDLLAALRRDDRAPGAERRIRRLLEGPVAVVESLPDWGRPW